MATPTTLPAAFVAGAILTADQMNNLRGAFRVLQVVQGSTSTSVGSSTTTYADTGLSATITPTSASSLILVMVTQAGALKSAGNIGNAVNLRLFRGATNIMQITNSAGFTNSFLTLVMGNISTTFLDNPATTSATTYKTQFANDVVAADIQLQVASASKSTITLMEISA